MSMALGSTVMGQRQFPQPTNPLLRRRPGATTALATTPVSPVVPASPVSPTGFGVTGQSGSTGNAILDLIRGLVTSQANSRIAGARTAAMGSSPNDPSMAAFAGLSGLLGGQTDAARTLGSGALSWGQMMQGQDFQREMAKMEEEARLRYAKAAAGNPLAQFGGQVVGTALGSRFGGH